MARPGGNPELKKYQFSSEGEPNNAQLRLWVTKSLLTRLNNTFGANRNKWIRETLTKALDEIDENHMKHDMKNFEEETKMPLLTNIELKGIETGKEIGTLEKAHDYVKLVLKTRLGDIPETIAKGVDTISVLPILDELLKLAIKVDCFEDFHQSLLKLSPKKFESNESDKS